jgi:hypothetical protein
MRLPRRRIEWFVWLGAIALVLVTIRASPTYYRSSGCLFCGCRMVEQRWLGVNLPRHVDENECSRWVRSLHPGHSIHIWSTSSIMRKDWGFAGTTVGCATGAGGLMVLHDFRSQLGEERARELLARYHSELKGEPDSFRRFVRTDLNTLLTNALPGVTEPD